MSDLKIFKIGLDLHGILNDNPVFVEMGKLFVAAGHEVHVITGLQYKTYIKRELKGLKLKKDVHYTHFFSIADHLIEEGKLLKMDDEDNPFFRPKDWDRAKGKYCKREQIDIHFDDSFEYGKYFSTPFFLKLKNEHLCYTPKV